MDLSNTPPLDESRLSLAHLSRTALEAGRATSSRSGAPAEKPEHGGVVAPSEVEGGEVRDPAAQRQTSDQVGRMRELLAEIANSAGIPADTEVSIDVQRDSIETMFVIRDKNTLEVLHQVRLEEGLDIAMKLSEASGLLVDTEL